MRLAFLFSVYTDAPHLKRLLSVLPDGSHAFVHVDAKSDIDSFRRIVSGEHIHYLNERYNVVWGSYRQTQYQMALVRAALQSGICFDYLITMSGMEYPVWSNHEIVSFLARQRRQNRELLQAIDMTRQTAERQRLYVRHWPFNNIAAPAGSVKSRLRVALRQMMFWTGRRKPLEFNADGRHYRLFKGSDWFGITPQLGRFVVERWEASPELRRYFEDSFTPSETAIHTIAFNSAEFADRCMLVDGPYTSLADLTPLTYINYTPGTVDTLDENDLAAVLASRRMFCRKVVTGRSDRLMELLDERRRACSGTAQHTTAATSDCP